MASFQAIGGVSVTLKTLLSDRMDPPPESTTPLITVPVSLGLPPDDQDSEEEPRLNVFLYRVTENGNLKNQDLPGVGHPGAFGHPPLSLVLHYLLTAYGATKGDPPANLVDERVSHYVLGAAMRVLHDVPVVTEELRTSTGMPVLHSSLQNEFEQVKLTLEPLTLEDVSKVWTALNRPYRLSAAYEVSVVQIESRRRRVYPRLVGAPPPEGPRVRATPGLRPRISEVVGSEYLAPYARMGDTLIVRGSHLAGDRTRVTIGSVDATAQITSVRTDQITVVVPDDERLQPGPQSVHVTHEVLLGEPPTPHGGPTSNIAAFVLVPRIDGLSADFTVVPPTLQLTGRRLLTPTLDSLTLVGDTVIPRTSYTATSTPTQLSFDLPGEVSSGDHLVRVRVNGAESLDERILTVP